MASRPHFVLSAVAREGHGKTHFAFSAPKPICYVTVDPNTEAVRDKLKDEGKLDPATVQLHTLETPAVAFSPRDDVKDTASVAWDAYIEILRPLVEHKGTPRAATVVLDTATELHELNVQAEFGRTDQISPNERQNKMGVVNTRWKGVIRALQNVGLNVILLHRGKDRWEEHEEITTRGRQMVSSRIMGAWELDRVGFKYTGNIVSAEVLLAFDRNREREDGKVAKLADKYGLMIDRTTLRPALIGQEYWGRDPVLKVHRASFAHLAVQLYPQTVVGDWL